MSVKKTVKAFRAKKEVTKKDAQYLKNLLSWRLKENKRIRESDNWSILSVGIVIGAALMALFKSV